MTAKITKTNDTAHPATHIFDSITKYHEIGSATNDVRKTECNYSGRSRLRGNVLTFGLRCLF